MIRFFKIGAYALLVVAVCGILWWTMTLIPSEVGDGDFRPYWTSALLLRNGQDFSSQVLMEQTERELTGWRQSFTMMAWFAPNGNLILLPFTFLPFFVAVRIWMLLNIGMLLVSARLLRKRGASHSWVFYGATFLFSSTLVSLAVGQVNTLEILGLALFLVCLDCGHPYAAGAGLALTTIKPHLVILTLPLLLLDLTRRRQWRVLFGFGGALSGCAVILAILNPEWPFRFWQLVSSGMGSIRQSPTLAGLLVEAGDTQLSKWLWLVALVVAGWFWWKFGQNWNRKVLIDLSLVAGLIVAPIGWSYDQILLLIPILHILEWIQSGLLNRTQAGSVVFVLIIADLSSIFQRGLVINDVWFFWLPWIIGVLYLWVWRTVSQKLAVTID